MKLDTEIRRHHRKNQRQTLEAKLFNFTRYGVEFICIKTF